MLRLRDRSRSSGSGGSLPQFTSFSLQTNSLPSGFVYTRTTTNEFYRNSSGKFVNAASNEARFDYDFDGTALGLRFDHASTNKCTNTNWNMANLTGLTTGGNASASVSVSTHPVHGHATILIDNTLGGSGTAYVDVAGSFGNTNAHSASVVCRNITGTGAFLSDSGGAFSKLSTKNGQDEFIKYENFTPSNSARTLRLAVAFGCKAHFWLNQLEELDVCTFPLLVAGATATRTLATCYIPTSSIPTYSESQGAIIVETVFDRITNAANQYIAQLSNNGSTANTHGIYAVSSSYGQIRGRTAISSTAYTVNDTNCPIRGKRYPVATTWQNGQTMTVAGACHFIEETYTGAPTGMNRIYIGGRSGSEPFAGWIRTLTVANQYCTLEQLAGKMFPPVRSYKGVIGGGQSNMKGRSRSAETKQNGGEVAAVAEMDARYTSTENWFLNAGSDGSAIDKANDAGGTNHWYDRATGNDGPCMVRFERMARAFGVSNLVKIVPHDQGASDASDSVANFQTSTLAVFGRYEQILGTGTKIVICPIASRADQQTDNYDTVKKAQRNLVELYPAKYYEAPPQNGYTLGADSVHLSNSSYAAVTTNLFRKIAALDGKTVSGAVDPPTWSSASRSGVTVTVPISFPTGITALTPTSGISGFRAFDGDPDSGGSEITINAATYSGGNVSLTLNSTPSGSLYVEYARGGMYVERANSANFARGNDANTLGLAWNKVIAS